MRQHTVQAGECVSSIAEDYGFEWERLWNLPENGTVKRNRLPNQLHPGDVLSIPDKVIDEENCVVEKLHPFVRKGLPVRLKLRVLAAGKPVADQPYELWINGKMRAGTTTGGGRLDETIPPTATRASLLLGPEKTELKLDIGHLSPIREVEGVQARLNNLGYHCGRIDGVIGPQTRSAIKAFQETYELPITGEASGEILEKLEELYGS